MALGQTVRWAGHAVAEGRRHRPAVEASGEEAIHQQAGAYLRVGVDERLERRVLRQLAGKVVVEVTHIGTGREQPRDIRPIAVVGDVQHRDPLTGAGLHSLQKGDIALHPADQTHLGRQLPGQSQLLQGAEAVRVAVEGAVRLSPYPIHRHFGLLCSVGLIAAAVTLGRSRAWVLRLGGLTGPGGKSAGRNAL
ncbi:hypothetical protein D3C78_1232550 [compost metagenome]